MSDAHHRARDLPPWHGAETVALPYDEMALNGGGIHCSTCPPVRDPLG